MFDLLNLLMLIPFFIYHIATPNIGFDYFKVIIIYREMAWLPFQKLLKGLFTQSKILFTTFQMANDPAPK